MYILLFHLGRTQRKAMKLLFLSQWLGACLVVLPAESRDNNGQELLPGFLGFGGEASWAELHGHTHGDAVSQNLKEETIT